MHHLYSDANPRRPPDWRWHRAQDAALGILPISRLHDRDTWVGRIARFFAAFNACATAEDYGHLSRDHSPLYWAHSFWFVLDNEGNNAPRSEIEARLLADQPYTEIATRMSTTPDVIEAYAR